jgi:N-methylhydantoinase A
MTEHVTSDQIAPSWRIGVDVGGTFTDMVVAGPGGGFDVFKVPSSPQSPETAVMDAVTRAAAYFGIPVADFLGKVTHFIHGTTIATNTALEGKGARVGLITTDGFRDALEIRRGFRENAWDHHTPYVPVLVPRHRRIGIGGRLDATGSELCPIPSDDLDRAANILKEEGVEAVAICLTNSFLSGVHEQQTADRLRRVLPDAFFTLSSDVAPIMGEYERGSTAVLNCYIGPRTTGYLQKLERGLGAAGLRVPLLLVQNNGGITAVSEIASRPVNLMLSGPAAAVGTLSYLAGVIGRNSLISMEIGGTSCDVVVMRDGDVSQTDGVDIAGYDFVSSTVEVHSIGAGGGTIARVDDAGMLLLGPEGAGARPGPACYGWGGDLPTVTDAHVVLGRFKPGPLADGTITIDADRAEAAIRTHVADPLDIATDAAAVGLIRLIDQKLVLAVQKLSTERGYDPRDFDLVAGGGAGPLHAVNVARHLGCRRVYVPRASGAFCAIGMLASDCRHDHMRFFRGELEGSELSKLEGELHDVSAEVVTRLEREDFAPVAAQRLYFLDLRYVGQQWDITVPVTLPLENDSIRAGFEARHQQSYGHTQPGGRIEIRALRAAAIGAMPKLPHQYSALTPGQPAPVGHRRIWVDEAAGWQDVPCYAGDSLKPGNSLTGPAVVMEQTTTLLIGQDDALRVDAAGNFAIMLAGDADEQNA